MIVALVFQHLSTGAKKLEMFRSRSDGPGNDNTDQIVQSTAFTAGEFHTTAWRGRGCH